MLLSSNNSIHISSIEDFEIIFEEKTERNTDSFSLFNRVSFQEINYKNPNAYFLIRDGLIEGVFLFHQIENLIINLYKSSYGGFEFFENVLPIIKLKFIKIVLEDILNRYHFSILKITFCPEIYFKIPILADLSEYYSTKKCIEISHYIDLNQNWKKNIAYSHVKKLNKNIRSNFYFEKVYENDLSNIYELIKDVRVKKGYPVTMNYEDLRRNIMSFPDEFSLFCVKNEVGEIISGAVCLEISSKIMYLFYIGHDVTYNSFSPNTYLIISLAEYFQNRGYAIFDIGVSSEDGVRNEGLSSFKESLGCQISEKHYYTLQKV